MSKNLVSFRVDAYPEIGAGHLKRCMALAKQFSVSNWAVNFLINESTLAFYPSLSSCYTTSIVNNQKLASFRSDIFVMDGYQFGIEDDLRARECADKLCIIDDEPKRQYASDVLLDASYNRKSDDYKGRVSESTELLLGPSYSLLNPVSSTCLPQTEQSAVRNVFICFGYWDSTNRLFELTKLLSERYGSLSFHVCLNSKAVTCGALVELAKTQANITLHIDKETLSDIIGHCDVGIVAAGTTIWQCFAQQLPLVIVPTVDNQEYNAVSLVEGGYALTAKQDEEVANMLASLLDSQSLRTKLSNAGNGLCDGQGVTRVYNKLIGSD